MILGLTGGIASGKSTVARMLVERGFRHVDADALARVAVEPGQPALAEISQRFGAGVLLPDGRLDRVKLGRIVFGDFSALAELNAITHPRIAALIQGRIAELKATDGPILLDHPLLYETAQDQFVSGVIVVWVDRETQLSRLQARNGYTLREAQARIEAQMDLREKTARADFVIDNSGTLAETQAQVEKLCRDLAG